MPGTTNESNVMTSSTPEITGYTQHGWDQATGRDGGLGVSENAIISAVSNPINVISQADNGTVRYEGADATVILNENNEVVTTWSTSSNGVRNKE
jgi:hypothetical protein